MVCRHEFNPQNSYFKVGDTNLYLSTGVKVGWKLEDL